MGVKPLSLRFPHAGGQIKPPQHHVTVRGHTVKVLAAMSGGVDSAVAAARLVEAGHDVTGVHLALSRNPRSHREGSRGCCSLEDSFDARRAADRLGIPFYVWDFSDRFVVEVIDPFIAEYRKLYRSVDPGKDQSYVLAVLNQDQLSHSLFPLGNSLKVNVRQEAAALGLSVADKPDSNDICFIPDGDTPGWLSDKIGSADGEIRDESGALVGHHNGYHHFTIGQRRGLRLGVPAPDGKPRYVLDIEPVNNTVVVGGAEGLTVHHIEAIRPVWCSSEPVETWHGQAQVRAHGDPVPAIISAVPGGVAVELEDSLRGVAPGQAVVFYDGDLVVGSATICGTDRAGVKAEQAA